MLIKLASTRDREAMNVKKVTGHFSPTQTVIVIPIKKSFTVISLLLDFE